MLRRIFLALAVVIAMSAMGQEFTLHATKYHPGQGGAGWVTASGDRINYDKLKNYQIRWVALSHDMFKQHGFKMGDVIIVESESTPAINGEWVVKDKMGPRLRKRIDFLTPRGDKYNFRNGAVTIRKKGKASN